MTVANALLIFTKWPEPGQCKTRLIPALGAVGAARLHARMVARVVLQARRVAQAHPIAISVYHDGGCAQDFGTWLGPDIPFRTQSSGDLGVRLNAAFAAAFASGLTRVVVIGTDCPDLDESLLSAAFEQLDSSDIVLGPAEDGGYYLIGLTSVQPRLFEGIAWGGDQVCRDTLERAAQLELTVALLPKLSDVDRPEDIFVWEQALSRTELGHEPPALSVIIPTLNEAGHIASAIASATDRGAEIIVADGGSLDATREIASAYGATVVTSAPGRAVQMNEGAKTASGTALLFLHADTLLPPGYLPQVMDACADARTTGGAFRLRLKASEFPFRVIEAGANCRSRALLLPYGDQGIFVRSETFRRIGGYHEQPIMEDAALVRRIRKHGRLVILDAHILTSTRRWKTEGLWRTTILHLLALGLYTLRIPPRMIANFLHRYGRVPCKDRDSLPLIQGSQE